MYLFSEHTMRESLVEKSYVQFYSQCNYSKPYVVIHMYFQRDDSTYKYF